MRSDHPKIKSDGNTLKLGFGEYGREVEVATISANGKRVLLVEQVGKASIFDIDSGKLVQSIEPKSPLEGSNAGPTSSPFKTFIEAADFNHDGSIVVLGLNDGHCHLYEVVSGKLIGDVKEPFGLGPAELVRRRAAELPTDHWELIRTVCVSPDGEKFAVGHFNAAASVWRTSDCELLGYYFPTQLAPVPHLMPRPGFTTSVSFSPDSDYLFCGQSNGSAMVYSVNSGECEFQAIDHTVSILTVCRIKNEIRWLTSDGYLWTMAKGTNAPKILKNLEQSWMAAKLSPSGDSALVQTSTQAIHHLDFARDSVEELIPRGPFQPRRQPFVFGADDNQFCFATPQGFICRNGNREYECSTEGNCVNFVLSNDNSLIAVATYDGQVMVWDWSGNCIGEYSGTAGIGSIAVSNDNKLLAIGELGNGGGLYDRHVYVFALESGELISKFVADQFQILDICFQATSDHLITKSKSISIWKIDSNASADNQPPRLLQKTAIANHSNPIRFLQDGRTICFHSGHLHLFEQNGNLICSHPFQIGYKNVFEINEQENELLINRHYNRVESWNFLTGKLKARYSADIDRPIHLPNPSIAKEYRATARAIVWQTQFGNFLHLGDGPRGWVTPLQLSGCGQFLVVPCEEKAILLNVDDGEVLAECAFSGRFRASVFVDKRIAIVNSEGQLFSSEP